MGETHNALSLQLQGGILQSIRKNESPWNKLFSASVTLVNNTEWPLTDGIIRDDEKKIQCGVEFKPPGHDKREYLTGLGQALAYLDKNEYSLYILPEKSNDGFPIGEYIKHLLTSNLYTNIPIGLVTYSDSFAPTIQREIPQVTRSVPHKAETSETFWAFWREISLHEIYLILKKADELGDETGNIKKKAMDWFYQLKIAGKTKDPSGDFRQIGKKGGGETALQNYANYTPFINALGYWDSQGHLTQKGYGVLHVGKIYGYDSAAFKDEISKSVLTDGKHLQLMLLIDKFQFMLYKNGQLKSQNNEEFNKLVENHLEDLGLLQRASGRRTTSKRKRLQSELTLWWVLGLIVKHKATYFIPQKGYQFDWERITELLNNRAN